jgi:hypothetical protein
MMKRIFTLLILWSLLFGNFCLAEDITARSQKTFTVPGNVQIKIDYLTGTNPIYIGYADKGVATSDATWFILKITWDANNNPTVIQSANNAVWDDRATTVVYS